MWPFKKIDRGDGPEDDYTYVFPPEVKASLHADGVVFLHTVKGTVLSSNRVGARIWQSVGEGKGLKLIAAEISRELGAPEGLVKQDAAEFLRNLVRAGILARNGRDERKAR